MRDFPTCFGENGVQVADSSSSSSSGASSSTAAKTAQNLVTCLYQCRIRGRPCLITLSWTRTLMGQGLSFGIDDSSSQCLCKFEIKPWLFSRKKGSRSLEAYSCKVDIFWDLSSAKFGSGSPEPQQSFYVAVLVDKQMILLLGDMRKEAFKKTSASAVLPLTSTAVFVAKREHLFGKKVFTTKAQFCDNGQVHDLVLECDTTIGVSDPCLVVRVDRKTVLQVKRLKWKFRGNHTIFVDGLAVEVLWDVHNWLFGGSVGNAVFMFRTCREKMFGGGGSQELQQLHGGDDDPSSLTWSSFSQRIVDCKSHLQSHQNPDFKLVLYAWKSE